MQTFPIPLGLLEHLIELLTSDGQIIFSTPYWEEGDYGNDQQAFPSPDTFSQIAQKIQNRFFTIDVARKRDGTWNIIELGDGQVAGLPASTDRELFYQTLLTHRSMML